MLRPDAQVENVEPGSKTWRCGLLHAFASAMKRMDALSSGNTRYWRSLKHVIPCTSASTNWKAGSGNSTVPVGKAANTSRAMTYEPQSKILAYLKAGGRLTVRKAERLYHTTELRRIISRLRKMGYSICSNKQKAVTEDGRPTQFNEYYMPQVADSCQ